MARRLRALDLFCCGGGAGMGLHRAGFEVVGVDIEPQPKYPFEFFQADALDFPLDGYDFIWASPPCQRYSDLARRNGNASDYPDLVGPIRRRLLNINTAWVIENVEGAPLRTDLLLCGTMFPSLRVLRHRIFELSFTCAQPKHPKHPLVFTHDKRKPHHGKLDQDSSFVQVTGGGNCSINNARDAMGIDWLGKYELNQAVPPAYSEYIAKQFLASRQ